MKCFRGKSSVLTDYTNGFDIKTGLRPGAVPGCRFLNTYRKKYYL